MAKRPRRTLRPEELELWHKVVGLAEPLPEEKRQPFVAPTPPPPGAQVSHFRVGQAATPPAPKHDLAPTIAQQFARQHVSMDKKIFGKMRKGRLVPEARIDLHGMTIAQAHPALTGFILNAARSGARLVLVITGKGKVNNDPGPIPQRHGVLRHHVPHWLNTAPLRAHILQITEAHIKHGGSGAYYVYLRRTR